MSTPELWRRVVKTFTQPPKPKRVYDPKLHPKIRMSELKKSMQPSERPRAPNVLPWIAPKVMHHRTGTQGHLRKRKLQPAMRDWRMGVTLLAGDKKLPEGKEAPEGFIWQQLRHKDVKEMERFGGLEGKMISTPSSKLSTDGKLLRHALFCQLYRLKGDASYTDGRLGVLKDEDLQSQVARAKSTGKITEDEEKPVYQIEAPMPPPRTSA